VNVENTEVKFDIVTPVWANTQISAAIWRRVDW